MPPVLQAGKLHPRWASASVVAFLGMLHMEIIQERLEREYDLDLITTAPTVVYEIELNNGETIHYRYSPAAMPPVNNIKEMREPIAKLTSCCRRSTDKRDHPLYRSGGVQTNMVYHGKQAA